ncbi:MAG: GGDEF domain-containing protein [Cellulosilyticum sp.]|nr:GGDEF domain-containing protein [Cellulosilyticum sp.]
MEQEIEILKELEKLKNAPQYVDLFCNIMQQKLGENQEAFTRIIDDAIAYYKNNVSLEVCTKLIRVQLDQALIYGELDYVIKTGEDALDFLNKVDYIEGTIIVNEKIMLAYMYKGLFKTANQYRLKAIKLLNHLQETSMEHLKAHPLVQGLNPIEDEDLLKPLESIHYQKLHIRLILSSIKFYIMIEEYKTAKEQLLCIKEMEQSLTPQGIQESLLLRLELDLVEEDIEEAMVHVQEMQQQLGEEMGQKYIQTHSLRLRAILNHKRSLHMQAEKDFNLAIEVGEKYKEIQVQNLISYADYLVEQKRSDEAYEKVTRAIKLAGKIDSPYFFVQGYKRLAHIYEVKKQWEFAYKTLHQLNKYRLKIEEIQIERNVSSVSNTPIEDVSHIYSEQLTNDYKRSYEHLEQIARLGKVLSSEQSISQLPATIHKEIAPLIDLDVMGIAMLNQEKVDYSMYELSGKWLSLDNDIVRYTSRLVDYSTQFHADIIVNDGNFEEYTIKRIINSESNVQLQSMIVFILKVENNILGAMTLGSYKSNAYSQKDIAVARILASYLGLMLKNIHLYQKIDYLSDHDVLTGVLSRHVILKKGEKLFKENHKKGRNTAIIILETDLFKRLNTKHGYELGNEILSKIGKTIKESLSQKDDVGRYDGKAFIAILDHLNNQEATQLAEKIKENVERLTFETKKEQQIKVTLSGGIYICNEYTLSFDDAIQFANHALYRAKLLGRNCIMSYSLGDKK